MGFECIAIDVSESQPPASIEGPRLPPFRHDGRSISILECLSGTDELRPPAKRKGAESSAGGHGHVFKVRIGDELYALKVFKYFDLQKAREDVYPFANHEISDDDFRYHTDPFYAECRAYAKLRELEIERRRRGYRRDLAVPSYGYVYIRASCQQHFAEQFQVTDWKSEQNESGQPLRALVKTLVKNKKAIMYPNRMLSDLKALRKGGIYPRDIAERNYINGSLVDLSMAWTKPHWVERALVPDYLAGEMLDELYDFDKMIAQACPSSKTYAIPPRRTAATGLRRSARIASRAR